MVLRTTPQILQEGGYTNGQENSGETNLRTSGSGVFQIAQELSISYGSFKDMCPEEVYNLFYPDKHVNETLFQAPNYDYNYRYLFIARQTANFFLIVLNKY